MPFINFYAIRYGDTVEQTTCTFSRSIRANDITTASPYIAGRDLPKSLAQIEREKLSGRTLFNCISVTDGIKINEQYKSIVIGPRLALYLRTKFEVI